MPEVFAAAAGRRCREGLGDAGGPLGGAGLVDAGIRHAETKGRLVKRATAPC